MTNKQEKNLDELKTSELLDALESAYTQDLEPEVLTERVEALTDELRRRSPFSDVEESIIDLQQKVNRLAAAIEQLQVHRHLDDGSIAIPLQR